MHLRFGPVARGGLRWSDRREDFRTEVLGLVKAQMVKNAVIVPTGAKGGFVAKQLPDPAVDREAWLAEGMACYRMFISGLLDITDNLRRRRGRAARATWCATTATTPTWWSRPTRARRRSPTSPTRSRSRTASGSATRSPPAARPATTTRRMGITARGAWESVKRHFRELGVDTQSEDFTVVGVGDMSGDVFGNGMLLSEHIRLVAAFDHRHIFLDPDPGRGHVVRRAPAAVRPAALVLGRLRPVADLRRAAASSRARLKSIPVTPQMRAALGLAERRRRR